MSIPEIHQNQRIDLKNIRNDVLHSNKPFSLEYFFEKKLNDKANLELHSRQKDFEKIRNQKIDEKNIIDKRTENKHINQLNQQDYIERKINEEKKREEQQNEKILENSKTKKSASNKKDQDTNNSNNNLSQGDKTKEQNEIGSVQSIDAQIEDELSKKNTLTEDLKKIQKLNQFYRLKKEVSLEDSKSAKNLEKINNQLSKDAESQDNKILDKSKILESLIESNNQKKYNLEQNYKKELEDKIVSNIEGENFAIEKSEPKQSLDNFLEKEIQSINDKKHQEKQIIDTEKESHREQNRTLLENAKSIIYGYDSIQNRINHIEKQKNLYSEKGSTDLHSISNKSIRKEDSDNRVRNSDKAISVSPNESLSKSNQNKQIGTYDAQPFIMKAERTLPSSSTTSATLIEDTRNLTNTEPEQIFNNKPIANETSFKDRTAYHWDSKKVFYTPHFHENSIPTNSSNNYKSNDLKTLDKEIYTNNDDEKIETSSLQSNNNNSSDDSNSSSNFNHSTGGDQLNQNSSVISQNESAVDLVENKIAPEILKQIERIRKMGKSWVRISIDDHLGNPLNLHMQVRGNVIQVRFGTNSEGIRSAIEISWDGIVSKANQIGIQLNNPRFITYSTNYNP